MAKQQVELSFIDNSSTTVQLLAVDPQSSIFVSASAGTGKTKVLCDRFVRLLLSGSPVENILCVTFTKFAAKEMLTRILQQISAWNSMTSAELKQNVTSLIGRPATAVELKIAGASYTKMVDKLPRLKIQTLHSFCHNLLNKYSESNRHNDLSTESTNQLSKEMKLGKKFNKNAKEINVIDAVFYQNLFDQAFDYVIECITSEQTPSELPEAFNILIDYYNLPQIKSKLSNVCATSLRLANYLKKFATPAEIKEGIFKEHEANINDNPPSLDAEVINVPHYIFDEISLLDPKLFQKMKAASHNAAAYIDILFTKEYKPRLKLLNNTQLYPIIAAEIERLEGLIERRKACITAQINYALLVMGQAVLSRLTHIKNAANSLQYDDLLQHTIDLLQNSDSADFILYSLDYRIDHILVDEAQDLSNEQWQLVKIISQEFFSGNSSRELNRTVFIVGDLKQSIFGFQGAQPDTFTLMREYFRSIIQNSGKNWLELEMDTSYRSTSAILELVNRIAKIKHTAHRQLKGHVEIWPLIAHQKSQSGDDASFWKIPELENSQPDPQAQLAQQIAESVNTWLTRGKLLAGHKKITTARDIMILVRKRSSLSTKIAACIRKFGIAVNDQDRINLNDELIICDLLAVIRFIAFPYDDLNLAALLKSPFFNFSEQQLFEFAYNRAGCLYDNLEVTPKFQLNKFINLSSQLSLTNFYYEILYVNNYIEHFIRRFGQKAQGIIESFLRIVYKYQHEVNGSYFQFLQWVNGSSISISPNINCDNAVRIMTVHAAKGLQAPIVILADAASSEQTPYDSIIWDDENLYFAVGADYNSMRMQEISKKNTAKRQEENLRLLYVALTRAEDELYIAGIENNRMSGSWYNIINNFYSPEFMNEHYFTTDRAVLNTQSQSLTLPKYFLQPIEKPIQSEQPDDNEEVAFRHKHHNEFSNKALFKGTLIHELLQKLPCLNVKQRVLYQQALSKTGLKYFTVDEILVIFQNCLEIIESFPEIFNSNTPSEKNIIVHNNHILRLDKLVIGGSKIMIVDFKTDNVPPKSTEAVKSKYLEQLTTYKQAVVHMFTNYKIECYILWTESKSLMQIFV